MSGTHKILITLLLACFCLTVKAQEPKDSLAIYKKLQEKASKHKVTQWIYDAIFVDMQNNEEDDSVVVSTNKHTENPFKKYDGKVIRSIRIVVYDPFGYSVNDTTMETPRGLARMGNVYHIKSRPGIIRNMLLFKKDDKLDPLRISESERILRQAPYVNDARIYISSVRIKKKKTDSVDVVVYTQDKWTFVPESNFSLDAPDILLTQKNVFGFGHELQMGFIHTPSANYITNYGRYGIFNIRKTFISSYVNYYNSRDLTYFGLVLDRPFYSPLAKWAGGVALTKNYGTFAYIDANNTESKEPLNSLVQDYWVARGWRTGSRKTIRGQSSNIIAGVRYENILFQQRPSGEIDVNRQNIDQATYLGSVGFTRREYYKERFIYRFGANEDVPVGFAFTLTCGYRQRELASSLYYNGVSFSIGDHFERFGYISGNVGVGSFYNRILANRGVVSISGNWFSELIRKNRWYMRQFASVQSVNGLNREAYEFININGRQMYGFNSPLLQGKNKLILNLETVFYTPYSILGFRFAPIVMMGFAKIGNSPAGMFNSRIYQSYSIGLLLRNENLIANSFQFSIGFYPYVPGTGSDVFQANPVGSFSLRVRDFTIGKPEVVGFQ